MQARLKRGGLTTRELHKHTHTPHTNPPFAIPRQPRRPARRKVLPVSPHTSRSRTTCPRGRAQKRTKKQGRRSALGSPSLLRLFCCCVEARHLLAQLDEPQVGVLPHAVPALLVGDLVLELGVARDGRHPRHVAVVDLVQALFEEGEAVLVADRIALEVLGLLVELLEHLEPPVLPPPVHAERVPLLDHLGVGDDEGLVDHRQLVLRGLDRRLERLLDDLINDKREPLGMVGLQRGLDRLLKLLVRHLPVPVQVQKREYGVHVGVGELEVDAEALQGLGELGLLEDPVVRALVERVVHLLPDGIRRGPIRAGRAGGHPQSL
mmetsp:Transcript_54186/g.132460  ORF Transcript_54186/g.132460 Transcript_54186/m.132460 type:complete len:321 (+) Transcript_54186:111-1073(+)